ncbi:amino acid ABC transporter ATP-binding protein [Glutamicibacter sp. JL.03c]|uniref:amino acid ABC transporter ATP-binding protein n=1 Tax=Glutamicibacter sp. JL.03c TaxID=2984842 RepID=UPI0021F74B92|nr:amino acid ABC transporter ATP-binding protein [Glutamicibacter sp. JL.03c]UYQ76797.1 amino acid ABC transporter ATP-binding protein [Glutamicibacter sp. JL.03c]
MSLATKEATTRGAVTVRSVDKSYGNQQVLHEVDLDVAEGEVLVIIGPSGSGKSTLLRTINHLEKVDRGTISLDGELIGYKVRNGKLHERPESEILVQRTEVGMVFQNFNLFGHLTALQNIIEAPIHARKIPKAKAVARAKDLLDRVGLADKADAYPRQLSGGQQQRVAIARALALDPKVVLFDEPTSALDPELVTEVLEVIKDLAKSGTTLIIVTHEIGFARDVADRIIFMDGGRVVEQGTPSELLTNPQHDRTKSFLSKVIEPAFNI